jgi:integrase
MICSVFKQRRRVNGTLVVGQYWLGRLRMPWETKVSTIALSVTDKRLAQQKLMEIRDEREMEHRGLLPPKTVRDAGKRPLLELLESFLDDVQARERAVRTVTKYRGSLKTLFIGCQWLTLADVTPKSFTAWRACSGLSPKTLNDSLASASCFMEWLRGQQILRDNPLEFVGRVDTRRGKQFRRGLTGSEAQRLLAAAPPERAPVYLFAMYTGIRRDEMNKLRVCDFILDGPSPSVRVRAVASKNVKLATQPLRPEVVDVVRSLIPSDAMPFAWVFRGKIPKVPTMKKDLVRAGIDFLDSEGRRVDFHSLRMTFGTQLTLAGGQPREVMEAMRHSCLSLTMKLYTDAPQLPVVAAVARLPSFTLGQHEGEQAIGG